MKILVTGAKGFVGKHVVNKLTSLGYEVFSYDIDTKEELLISYVNDSDFVIHLAGINRPLTKEEFYNGNTNFTKKVVDLLLNKANKTPIIFSSSTQASLDNDYGKSKKMAEDYILSSDLKAYVFRLSNVFGKWCKPNYNSALSTFAYNIAHNLPIEVRDRDYVVHFNYVDDIVSSFINCIEGKTNPSKEIMYVNPTYDCSLGHLSDLLYSFKSSIEGESHLPKIHDDFEYKLFITYCDYASDEGSKFNYASDARGSFEEIYKSKKYGQISINMSYPGILKGGHYHTYKKEIFMTVIGHCETRLRNINSDEIITYDCDGKDSKLVNISPSFTHDIRNIGNDNSYTIMWISEVYNPDTADTYVEKVDKE